MTTINSSTLQPLGLPKQAGDGKQNRKNPLLDDGKQKQNTDKTAGNHATDVGVGSHKMTAEEQEIASQKAREQAVDMSLMNARIMRNTDTSKLLDSDVAQTLKERLVMGFAGLQADDANYIIKPKRTVNMPIVQELAKQTLKEKAKAFLQAVEAQPEKKSK